LESIEIESKEMKQLMSLKIKSAENEAKIRREMGKAPSRLNHAPVYYAEYLRV
jgi:hypothetical protein